MPQLRDCLKTYTDDQDKVVTPTETVRRVRAILEAQGQGVLAETRRIDSGRLGIPVFLSVCGERAKAVMPTRKQMGKGASPEQAEASALMELVERYSFFSFWADEANFEPLTFSQAEARWPGQVIPVAEMLRAVAEKLPEEQARQVLDLVPFRFVKALHVQSGQERWLPLDFFKLLNEFNGSSAGNTFEEAVLQGACELVERHVSTLADRSRQPMPTLDPRSFGHPVVQRLLGCFAANGVQVVLKDMTMGQPVATVAAMAWDPATFPGLSEIVLTAGTASSPAKAAIRALTEVAQLAGDFHTGSVYEASGLPKPADMDDAAWITAGPEAAAGTLPDIERANIREEIEQLAAGLERAGVSLYAVETTDPALGLPAVYTVAPGLLFRERSPRASLGLFVGRTLAENHPAETATRGLRVLAGIYPTAPFIPFYEGLIALNTGDAEVGALKFQRARDLQQDAGDAALCDFYAGYALTQLERWDEARPLLQRAAQADPGVKEYHNLLGVSLFKAGQYAPAAECFKAALALDNGSAMDLANLGLCEKFLGQKQAAAEHLSAALRLDPGLDFAKKHLAELTAS